MKMFCSKCGCKISNEDKFCPSCGWNVKGKNSNDSSKVRTLLLRCKACNGELTVNENEPIMLCPYCGSRELIVESDEVKIAKITSSAYRDVELGKQQIAMEMKRMDIQEKNKNLLRNKKNKFIGFTMTLGSIGLFILCIEFQEFFGSGARLFIIVLCLGLMIAGINILKNENRD